MSVDFTEKFNDNKVKKWKEHYVDYDRMRSLLSKLKAVTESYASLAQANPEMATESESSVDFEQDLGAIPEGDADDEDNGKASETKSLVPVQATGGKRAYGSAGGEIGSNQQAIRDELAKRKRNMDDLVVQFTSELQTEGAKAATFCVEEAQNLENRLELLISTVQKSYKMQPNPDRRRRMRDSMILMKSARALIIEQHSMGDVDAKDVIIDEEDDIDEKPILVRNVVNEMESVKRSLVDLHRQTTLLFNFSMMTRSALIRLLKRFNNILPEKLWDWDNAFPEQFDGQRTKLLNDRINKIYAKWFCDNDIREAQAQMLTKKGDELETDWTQMRLGYRLGICFTLMVWISFDCLWNLASQGTVTLGGRSAFPVFRAIGGLLVWHWCWGVSVWVWSRFRINYVFLFSFNPRTVLVPHAIFNDCVDESIAYLVTLLLYYKSSTHSMPALVVPGAYPAALVIYMIWKLIFPLKQRRPLWVAIGKVLTSPISSPTFFHTYVADVFTSMVKVLLDLLWALCYFLSGDFLIPDTVDTEEARHEWQRAKWYKNTVVIICLFPLYIRLMQCLRKYYDTGERVPNLPNAFKYTMSQVVTLFGAFYPVVHLSCHKGDDCSQMSAFQVTWLEIFIFSSLYSWVWDVKMDWGLGRLDYNCLGPRLMFPSVVYYYGVIFADLFLRFMWMQSLVPPSSGAYFELPKYLTAINMTLELVRRTLWSFFRLENEHRKKTQHLGKDEDVDFVPLHFTTGHDHKYQESKERNGRVVLAEIAVVGFVVFALCVSVVISAEKASLVDEF